jgi:hypothetical protein
MAQSFKTHALRLYLAEEFIKRPPSRGTGAKAPPPSVPPLLQDGEQRLAVVKSLLLCSAAPSYLDYTGASQAAGETMRALLNKPPATLAKQIQQLFIS